MHIADDLARLSVLDILQDRVGLFKSWGCEELMSETMRDYFYYLLEWYKKLKKADIKKNLKV